MATPRHGLAMKAGHHAIGTRKSQKKPMKAGPRKNGPKTKEAMKKAGPKKSGPKTKRVGQTVNSHDNFLGCVKCSSTVQLLRRTLCV